MSNNGSGKFDLENTVEEEAYNRFRGNRDTESSAISDVKTQLGVMQKMATATVQEGLYRQLLLMGAFPDMDNARQCVAAIYECKMCGVDITPILDRVTAECAVRSTGGWGRKSQMSRVQELITALTHFTMQTTHEGGNYSRQSQKRSSDDEILH